MERMQKDGSKLEGTALETTVTLETVKGKEQTTEPQQSGGGGIGGMLGRKLMKKGGSSSGRSTVFTTNHAYLEVAKAVDAADLAIPAGFKEKK